MSGRLILGGGGGEEDERPLFELLVQWIGREARLLYWPMALPPEGGRHAQALAWIRGAFQPLGLHAITPWSDFDGRSPSEMAPFDAVFLGGGGTGRLLQQLRASGFDRVLEEHFRRGGIIYGGSAGAIVLGRDISTGAHLEEDRDGPDDLRGLDLVQGCGVACHYRPEHDAVLQTSARRIGAPVIALPERSGLVLEAGRLRVAGHAPAWAVSARGKRILPVGEEVRAR